MFIGARFFVCMFVGAVCAAAQRASKFTNDYKSKIPKIIGLHPPRKVRASHKFLEMHLEVNVATMGVVACPVALTNQPAGAFVFNVFYDFFLYFSGGIFSRCHHA